MDVIYLDTDTVIAINAAVGGGGAGVRDWGIVDSAVHRPSHEMMGVHAHATLWKKAAALLHGLATTQGFFDGNKRTAWIATMTFLEANGHNLIDLPAEWTNEYVNQIAQGNVEVADLAAWLRQNRIKGLHVNSSIKLHDLLADGDGAIRNTDFVGCLIVGPAVIYIEADAHFIDCGWAGTRQALLWPIAEDRMEVTGVIGITSCTFNDCRFLNVGVAGKEHMLMEMSVGLSESREEAMMSAQSGDDGP